MARPTKEGLDYYPFDVDFPVNEKTEAIMGEFGPKGVLFMIYLLSAVYQNGYYLQWNKLKQNQLANRIEGVSPDLAGQIVNRLIAYGTFNKELFNSAKVLTSQRIQDTYEDATKRRKTAKPTDYWINVDNNYDSTGVNDDINAQSKVNKSKDKKKPKKRTYAEDSEEYQLANYLLEKIKANDPEVKEPDLQTWANDIRLMIERDNRKPKQIHNMIDWCQDNEFWFANILSAKKLRAKYDTMRSQALRDTKTKSRKTTNVETVDTRQADLGDSVYNAYLNNDEDVEAVIKQYALDGITLSTKQIEGFIDERIRK